MTDTPTYYLAGAGTPIYDAIREQSGVDPAAIAARRWTFYGAYMRLFGQVPDTTATVEKIARAHSA